MKNLFSASIRNESLGSRGETGAVEGGPGNCSGCSASCRGFCKGSCESGCTRACMRNLA